MAQEIIYTQTKSHWDSANWNSVGSGEGFDSHIFTVPEGMKFARYSLDVDIASMASSMTAADAPKIGATGEQSISIRWWYNSFGKIKYTVTVYAGDPEPVPIWHNENNWAGKSMSAIKQGLDIDLMGRGPSAKKLFARLKRFSGNPFEYRFDSPGKLEPVNITPEIPLGLIATLKYGTVGAIMLHALHQGYTVTGKFSAGGALPFDDVIKMEIRKQQV
jgi:hypothetical protein